MQNYREIRDYITRVLCYAFLTVYFKDH